MTSNDPSSSHISASDSSSYLAYQAPKSELAQANPQNEHHADEQQVRDRQIAGGQKRILVSFVSFLMIFALNMLFRNESIVSLLAIPFYFISYFAGIFGVFIAMRGLQYAIWVRVLILVFCHFPVINLLLMLSISGRCTKYLTQRGFRVGLFGTRMT